MDPTAEYARGIVPLDGDSQPSLDLVIAAWLDAKGKRTGSARTARAYRDAIVGFRAELRRRGLDLDAADGRAVALIAQAWAGRPRRRDGAAVTAATFNQRLAILSSFYAFGQRRELLTCGNPLARVERRPVQQYAGARALSPATVAERMAAIDRATPGGKRDFALLALALQTGRRLSELAGLRVRHLGVTGGTAREPELTVRWPRAKGDKQMADALPPAVSRALLAWLAAAYGSEDLDVIEPTAPVWVSLARNGSRGRALSLQGIADVCERRLGTSKVHALRHTFAHGMESVGAKVSEIQARLGHSSLATTGRYLAALRRAENTHAEDLAALFGLDAKEKKPSRPRPREGRGGSGDKGGGVTRGRMRASVGEEDDVS